MTICTICRFETELDDVVVRASREGGHCICLCCFARQTGTERPMPKALRRDIIAALAALEAVER
jgi:hypothetical protein